MDLNDIIKAINELDNYLSECAKCANILDKIFNTMLEQFNSIGIKTTKLLIQDRFILIFPEDFEDLKLFDGFRQWFDEKNHSLSICVSDILSDRSPVIMICDNMYQNISRITDMQHQKGIWPPKAKDNGTD